MSLFPALLRRAAFAFPQPCHPGEYFLADASDGTPAAGHPATIAANVDRATAVMLVQHTGDRPVQVGSHDHFFEVNPALHFERAQAYGMGLNIPAGTSVRFEPGDEKEVNLVAYAGGRTLSIPRNVYVDLYGPTTGDRIRLADSELVIEVERDFTVYGDEVTFGGGKVIRDGMGQSNTAIRSGALDSNAALGLFITNAVIIDHWGIVKGDIGIKDGRIIKVGPDHE